MIKPTNHIIARAEFTLRGDFWHFGEFRNTFLPNIAKDQIKSRDPGTVPFGKSSPGYCVTLIKGLMRACCSNL